MSDALEQSSDGLKLEARRRAVDGVDEPVIYQGELCGVWVSPRGKRVPEGTKNARFVPLTIKRYSDGLLVRLLQAHCPEFRDSVKHEHSGPGGGAIPVRQVVIEVPACEPVDDQAGRVPDPDAPGAGPGVA